MRCEPKEVLTSKCLDAMKNAHNQGIVNILFPFLKGRGRR